MKIVAAFSERLTEAMGDMRVVDLAAKLGISKQSVSAYINGSRQPKQLALTAMARILSVDPSWLMGYDVPKDPADESGTLEPIRHTGTKIPLYGDIACGTPILCRDNIEKTVELPESIHADFCLRAKGDSMIDARILDGDIVYIRKQPDVDDGQIAAVRIGDEATLKKVFRNDGKFVLMPCNTNYAPIVPSKDDDIEILGLVIGFTSLVK